MDKIYSILIVDDTKENIDILAGLLKDNYNLKFALSGKMALTIAEKFKPDLILLDIMMPEMDGYQTCKSLINDIKTAASSNNINIILDKLHQFKGSAGNLGLNDGYDLAVHIENELKIDNLQVLLEIESLEKIIDNAIFEISMVNIEESIDAKAITSDFKVVLKLIKEKVETYDIDAMDLIINNKLLFIENNLEDLYNIILNAINDYNYELALEQLNNIDIY